MNRCKFNYLQLQKHFLRSLPLQLNLASAQNWVNNVTLTDRPWAATRTDSLRARTARMKWVKAFSESSPCCSICGTAFTSLWPWLTVLDKWSQEVKTWWRLQQLGWILTSSCFATQSSLVWQEYNLRRENNAPIASLMVVASAAVACMWGVPPMKGSL